MSKKQGQAIKAARTNAGLTQAELAAKLKTVSASDISRAERGEKELTQDTIKQIAKITGVTQTSLLNAGKGGAGTASSAKTSSGSSVKLTAAEKRILELYRKADADTKKAAEKLLKGEKSRMEDFLNSLIGTTIDTLMKK